MRAFFFIITLIIFSNVMDIAGLYELYRKHSSISTDSRNIIPDGIFFALKGDHYDGNKFAADALSKGAAFAIVSDLSLTGKRYVHVDDTLTALQSLANHHRRHYQIPVIGITGSNGKTTTKELITAVLSEKYKVHATKGNFNNHIGVPLTLLSMPHGVEIAVVEMGANHAGEINQLCEIAMPTHGIITNIGKAHLEGFGSLEGVQKAKGELFDYVRKNNGRVFVNIDDPRLVELGNNIIEKTNYGFDVHQHPDIIFTYQPDEVDQGFTISSEDGKINIQSSMFGQYNAINMLAAYTIGCHFNVNPRAMEEQLSSYKPDSNRSQTLQHHNCTVIKDAYNANPSSMELALTSFAQRNKSGVVILGDMKELGSETDSAHRHIVEVIKNLKIATAILIGDNFKNVITTFSSADIGNITHFESIEDLKKIWSWDDCAAKVVLLKGSRSMHLERLLD